MHTRKEVKKPIFHIGVKDAVCPADPRDAMRREVAMSLLGEVLFSRSGALYHELLEEGLIAPDFSCGYSRGGDVAFFSVAGESDDPERVYRRIREYIDTVATHGIDPADYEAARRVVGADFIKDFDSTEEIAGNLLHFGFERFDIFQYLGIIESITADELLTLLAEAFRDEAYVLSVVS